MTDKVKYFVQHEGNKITPCIFACIKDGMIYMDQLTDDDFDNVVALWKVKKFKCTK